MNQQMGDFSCGALAFSCVAGGPEMNSWASQGHRMNCLQLCDASNAVSEAIPRKRQTPLTGVGHGGAKHCTAEHWSRSSA